MSADALPAGSPVAPQAVRDLMRGIVDYAGLFPPARLEMRAAVESYALYRAGADAWALGRFVVPVGRLDELEAAVAGLRGGQGRRPWRLSALIGPDGGGELDRIRAFNEPRLPGAERKLVVDTVEFPAVTAEEIPPRLREIPASLTAYVEIPMDRDPRALIRVLKELGARAKVRAGGVTPELFPPPQALLRFLRGCVEAELAFKATAGLHHAVAGRYRLTYEPDSPTATMYGYLNLLFATALLRREADEDRVAAVLGEADATAFRLADDSVSWREYRLSRNEIGALREHGMVAFGACSFREPLDEVVAAAGPEWRGDPRSAERP